MYNWHILSESAYKMKQLVNYFKTHKKKSLIIGVALLIVLIICIRIGDNLAPSTREAYYELTHKQSAVQKTYNYANINKAINENYLKINTKSVIHPRSSFQTLTLVNNRPLKIYNFKCQQIDLSQPSFLTRDKSKIDYTNSLMSNYYAFSPTYLKDVIRPDRSEPTKSYRQVLLHPINKNTQTNKRILDAKHQNLKIFNLKDDGAALDYWTDEGMHFETGIGELTSKYNWHGQVFYQNYARNSVKYDRAKFIYVPLLTSDHSINKSHFWQKNSLFSNSIVNNYHYHSNDNYGHDYNKVFSNAKYIGLFYDDYRNDYRKVPLPKTKTWSDKYGISKTNKYIKANEQVFHQECGQKVVTYQQIFNYFAKHNNILPTVNNQILENYNAENILDVAYNVYIHQLVLNRHFNYYQRQKLSKMDFQMPARPLIKPNWYMGSQFLFDSYALEPTKSLDDKCLIGTWFNVYVNADNVKAIDGKPIVETKENGQLYNANLKPYHDAIHFYNSYHIAFLDLKSPIKKDKNGIKYVPIKLGCNYAMPLNKTIQTFSYDHYKLELQGVDDDEEMSYYTRSIDSDWRKKADYYNNQTCYIPLSSLKQIAGKHVNQ